MLTIDQLREMGVQPEDGLKRCMDDENFYLTLVKMVPGDAGFQNLEMALGEQNLDAAFEAAHALKGVLGNLSLTPLFDPISEMTELLRNGTEMDYSNYAREIAQKYEQLRELLAEG